MRKQFTTKWLDGNEAKYTGKGKASCFFREPQGTTLRITPNGMKSWVLIYVLDGTKRTMAYGRYPTMSLEDARKKHIELHDKVKAGVDPLHEKRVTVQTRISAPTVEDLLKMYMEEDCRIRNRSADAIEKLIRKGFGDRLQMKVQDVKRDHIDAIAEEIKKRGAKILASRTISYISGMFKFALRKRIGGLEYNPCSCIPTNKGRAKVRALNREEIKMFWDYLDSPNVDLSDNVKRALKLVLITGQRPGEVVGIERKEISGNWWTIPEEKAKNTREHRVYLTPLALELLGSKKGFIFESEKGGKAMGVDVLCKALHRHFYTPEERPKKRGARKRVRAIAAAAGRVGENRIAKSCGEEFPPFTPHDLRRTMATRITTDIKKRLGDAAYVRFVIDKVQNHKKKGEEITDIYDQNPYDDEKQHFLTEWAKELMVILGKTPTPETAPPKEEVAAKRAKVIPLRAA